MENNVFLLGQQQQGELMLCALIIQMTLYTEKDKWLGYYEMAASNGYCEMSRLGWSCCAANQNLHSVPSQYLGTDVL